MEVKRRLAIVPKFGRNGKRIESKFIPFIANDKYIWSLLLADTHGANIVSVCARQFKSIICSERQIIFDVHYNLKGCFQQLPRPRQEHFWGVPLQLRSFLPEVM